MRCAEDHIDSDGSPRGIPPHASEPSLSFFIDIIGEFSWAALALARSTKVHDCNWLFQF
jgi:hypothetical protein